MFQFIVATICITLVTLGLGGCSDRPTNVERGNAAGELYIGIEAEPAGLDPHLTTGLTEMSVEQAFLEGLTTLNAKTMAVEPGVAKSWEISEDGRIYTFQFDPKARWSNGDPVLPSDFVFSYQRMLSPALGAPYAYMLYPIKGAQTFNTGQTDDFATVGVHAINVNTLQIELTEPTPYILSLMAHQTWWPVHPATILKHGAMTDRISDWTKAGNFVGNGPFIMDSWRINSSITASPNPYYRDAENVNLKGIHFLPLDIETAERAFRTGYIHIYPKVPTHRIDWYRTNRPENIRFDTSLGIYYFMLNVKRGPLADPRVRKALAYSIDRESITEYVLKAGQVPAYYFTPPNTGGYNARARFEYNPERARELLAEAGYPNGEGFPTFELLYNTSEAHQAIAVVIQEMWKKELGIDITLYNQEWKAYLSTREAGNFDILRASWFGDYDDPNTFLSLGETDNGNNHTGWSNERYDALIQKAAVTSDAAARLEIFQEAESILLEEMPVIPIYFYVTSKLIHKSVEGYYPSILDVHPFQAIQLKP